MIKEDKLLVQEYNFELNGELAFDKVVYNFVERDRRSGNGRGIYGIRQSY